MAASLFVWLTLLVCSALVRTENIPKNIIILAGQSNMAGRGGIVNFKWNGIVPPECQANPQIQRLSASLTWEEAKVPLHVDIDVNKTCGIGPGMAFSNALLKRNPSIGVIGLVPCAIGGTNISEWGRGSSNYNRMLQRTQAALNGGGQIRAMLWYQGESDADNEENANLYKSRLEKFFTDVRSDLKLPELPVIQVALANGPGSYLEMIRKTQLGIKLPKVTCVDAKGLLIQGDGIHLSTAGAIQLGGMLADAFLQNI